MVNNSYSDSIPTKVHLDQEGNYSLEVTPCTSKAIDIGDFFRYNITFYNHHYIDITHIVEFLQDAGYRIYTDLYERLKENPVISRINIYRTGVVTMGGYCTPGVYDINELEDFIVVSSAKVLKVLAVQKADPKDWTNQIVWVIGDVYKFMTICTEPSLEESMRKIRVIKDYRIELPEPELLMDYHAVSLMLRKLKPHIKTTCKFKNYKCMYCNRMHCRYRRVSESTELLKSSKNKYIEEFSPLDLL